MSRYGNTIRSFCYVVLALFIAGTSVFVFPAKSKNACAAGKVEVADSPCDPEYFKSMVARATLEADREVTQNQNLIYKPDSVLSYTCFDKHLSVLAEQATNMFSETTRWGQVLGAQHSKHMDLALTRLVSQALYSYLNMNFHGTNKKYMGGRSTITRADPDINVSGGTYSCTVMNDVWMEAKCYDFIEIEATDGFYPFDYYKAQADLRRLPSACTSKPPYDTNLSKALESPPWKNDPTKTYLDRFDAAKCGSIDPLPTGIEVNRPILEPKKYDEKVCIQPGCHFQPEESGPGKCVP